MTYALIVLALGTQAVIADSWHVECIRLIQRDGSVPILPVAIVLLVMFLAYAAILSLMLLRPA